MPTRKPDSVQPLDGGIVLHTYRNVPTAEAAPLVLLHMADNGYWDHDFAVGRTADVCTVLIYYKK